MEAQQTQLVQQGIKKEGFHITVTQMCITAVFMALTCVATMVVQIPIPLGYAHLGDSVILICAFFFGPVVGALAGGIGSAMADILTGFAVWAVPTLIIKTIMPIIACAIFGNMKSYFSKRNCWCSCYITFHDIRICCIWCNNSRQLCSRISFGTRTSS